MSKKLTHMRSITSILALAAFSLSFMACDPCRSFAEQVCECKESDQEKRRACIKQLNLAREHSYFKIAVEPAVCEAALEKCSCARINNNEDTECGMYRFDEK